ncbi:MAG: dephospho-CoA kinase [Planctomycetota bacterium]
MLAAPTHPERPLIVGIAGGIAAGKSAVASAFASLGFLVSDSDRSVRAALGREDVRSTLVEWWGPGILDPSGEVARSRVAEIVFAEPAERRRLESLVHPIVHAERRDLVDRAAAVGAPGVVIDAPLLFEAGVDAECDAVVFVDAPIEVRLERTRSRGWDAAELERREAAQMPLTEKRARSQFVVRNSGSEMAELEQQVRRVYDALRADEGP